MFNFEKMDQCLDKKKSYPIFGNLSKDDQLKIAKKIIPNLSWSSDEIRLSTIFLNACAELLFASEDEFHKKLNCLTLLFYSEIPNFPFHRMNPESVAIQMRDFLIRTKKLDPTIHDKIYSAIDLLMKLYIRHDCKKICSSLNVYGRDFNMILCPYQNTSEEMRLFVFGYGHNKYKEIMNSRPQNSTIIKCKICELQLNTLTTFGDLVILIAEEGIHCKCWQKFLEANPERNIDPCSAKGCDGSLCRFCEKYKEMQIMKFIGTINDLFKNRLLSEAIYNDIFSEYCHIIIGGSCMAVMPLVMKLYQHLPMMNVQLFDEFIHLINDFDIFFRRMKCLPKPNFLSTRNLRDFTKADYQEYMDELKRGQEQFETVIPKLGFCCCNEQIEYLCELNRRKALLEKECDDEKVGNKAVELYRRSRISGW